MLKPFCFLYICLLAGLLVEARDVNSEYSDYFDYLNTYGDEYFQNLEDEIPQDLKELLTAYPESRNEILDYFLNNLSEYQNPEAIQPQQQYEFVPESEESPVENPSIYQYFYPEEQGENAAENEAEVEEKKVKEPKKQPKLEEIKKGQDEYITFIDPQPQASFMKKHNFPEVQIKRSQSIRVGSEFGTSSGHNPIFMAVLAVGSVCVAVGVVGAAVVGYRVHRTNKMAAEAQYPQYGVIGPAKDKKTAKKMKAHGDATMAYGAQLHHYQQTKQQIIDMEQPKPEKAAHDSDDSDGEVEEADYSVYECPGLAPTGDIEIANPLFDGKNGGGPGSTSSDPEVPKE